MGEDDTNASDNLSGDRASSTDQGGPAAIDGVARRKPQRMTVRCGRLLVVAVLTYVGVSVAVSFLQSRLIYFPTREYAATPADIGLDFEELTLETSDGVRIAAWYVAHADPAGSLIFLHGNAGNMSDRLHSIKLLHNMGVNVLIIDYRGFGSSEGKPTEDGTYEDAVAAWQYLAKSRGESPDRIVLFGRSLGGAIAIELASRHPPAALVVESTFTNLIDVGRLHYPLLPVRFLLSYVYDSIAKVPQITCPKLFMHGSDDRMIPIENGRLLYDAAADPKRFLVTPGGHNEGGFTYSPEFTKPVAAFLSEVLQPK